MEKENEIPQHPCTQEEFNRAYQFRREKKCTFSQKVKRYYSNCSISSTILSKVPVVKWLPTYKFKKYVISDVASGFTVAVMHIPQGMAYASLGEVNPIIGLYMAIFPVLIYFLLGTSRHISVGTFAVVCLMASKPVLQYSTLNNAMNTMLKNDNKSDAPVYSSTQVGSVVCFTVGMLQVLLGFCKVGSLSVFMSESLVSGFTTGAAFLVLISQLEHVLGINLPRYFGVFKVPYTIYRVFCEISKTNYLALVMSVCVIMALLAYTDIIKPKLKNKCFLPIELIVMIIATIISHYFSLNQQYSIHVVGSIPMGIPKPNIPPLELMPKVLLDSIIIAVVSFSINISMATMFAMRENYKINANQELLAFGFGNMFGAFFSCLPVATSLSRSIIQYTSGGKTQLASVFSCLFLVTVLLYFGTFLEALPYCVLAGIVIKSLKGMFLQIADVPTIWKHSPANGVIWLSTFLSVVLFDIEIGLGVAIILSLLSIILMTLKTHICLLGQVPNKDIYLDVNRYSAAKHIPNFVIVRIYAGLHFANTHFTIHTTEHLLNEILAIENIPKYYSLVLDLSAISFIDPAALHYLKTFINDLKSKKISIFFVQCPGHVYDQMEKCDFFNDISQDNFFPSIGDAVAYKSRESNQVNTI